MLRILIISFFLTSGISSFSQSKLEKIFISLPSSFYVGLNEQQRKDLIKSVSTDIRVEFSDGENQKSARIVDFSPKSGYMHWNINGVNYQYMSMQKMCYWNCSNGSQLIGISHSDVDGPTTDEDIYFLKYTMGVTKRINDVDILQKGNISLSDILTNSDQLNLNDAEKDELLKLLISIAEVKYYLPKQGKDILCLVSYWDEFLDNDRLILYNQYKNQLKHRFEYQWNDCSFVLKK